MVRVLKRLRRTPATPIYNIGAASRLSGLPIWTLRWIERNGLIAPGRTRGRQRLFSDEDVARLARIRELLEQKVNLAGIRVLLLTTRGWRSGLPRVLPLLYVEHPKGYVVVASNAGDERDPAWWRNLEECPEAGVQVGRQRHAVRARRASLQEEAALWPGLLAAYPPYARYRERTRRTIPVVILERV